jgi:hypothetical protein
VKIKELPAGSNMSVKLMDGLQGWREKFKVLFMAVINQSLSLSLPHFSHIFPFVAINKGGKKKFGCARGEIQKSNKEKNFKHIRRKPQKEENLSQSKYWHEMFSFYGRIRKKFFERERENENIFTFASFACSRWQREMKIATIKWHTIPLQHK